MCPSSSCAPGACPPCCCEMPPLRSCPCACACRCWWMRAARMPPLRACCCFARAVMSPSRLGCRRSSSRSRAASCSSRRRSALSIAASAPCETGPGISDCAWKFCGPPLMICCGGLEGSATPPAPASGAPNCDEGMGMRMRWPSTPPTPFPPLPSAPGGPHRARASTAPRLSSIASGAWASRSTPSTTKVVSSMRSIVTYECASLTSMPASDVAWVSLENVPGKSYDANTTSWRLYTSWPMRTELLSSECLRTAQMSLRGDSGPSSSNASSIFRLSAMEDARLSKDDDRRLM
mmetsp:Transcript_14808/g.61677  ORF Transcript_14808/g.61677 Transcript_14808/m.61677 type:complete len:292 (+) Transcript_14808:975-1850(+)